MNLGPMDDTKAYQLIDAHLDHLELTEEQSDELSAWIKANPKNTDDAFYRIFLHSYLRMRYQTGASDLGYDQNTLNNTNIDYVDETLALPPPSRKSKSGLRNKIILGVVMACLLLNIIIAGVQFAFNPPPVTEAAVPDLLAYEPFDYPATPFTVSREGNIIWPASGGLHGLNGGRGWSEPWRETNSKVAIIASYDEIEFPWDSNDMRKFGPLSFTDETGHSLQIRGNLMRTATTPRSITARRFDFQNFPASVKDKGGLGRDGSVIWFSFLAQSSKSSALHNYYSYLIIGSKEVSGLRIGKLGAAPTGNWTAVGLLTGAEVNLQTSNIPSGQPVFLVGRINFEKGPEDCFVWINPSLETEPSQESATMHLKVPDFRFDGLAIHANHSSDFDEIRFGTTFKAVAPVSR